MSHNYFKTLPAPMQSRIIQYFIELPKKRQDEIGITRVSLLDQISNVKFALLVICAVLICAASFCVGYLYKKNNLNNTNEDKLLSDIINYMLASTNNIREFAKVLDANSEIITRLAEEMNNYFNIIYNLARNEKFSNNINQENYSPTDSIVIRELTEENNANLEIINPLSNKKVVNNIFTCIINLYRNLINFNDTDRKQLIADIVNYMLVSPDNVRKFLRAIDAKPEIITGLAEEMNNHFNIICGLARNEKFAASIERTNCFLSGSSTTGRLTESIHLNFLLPNAINNVTNSITRSDNDTNIQKYSFPQLMPASIEG